MTIDDLLARVRTGMTTEDDALLLQSLLARPGCILSAGEIADLCMSNMPMIDPYVPTKENTLNGRRVPSFGQDEVGYSIRPADGWGVLMPGADLFAIDVCGEGVSEALMRHRGASVTIPPNSFVLARSIERFIMPPDVIAISVGKSTYLRVGIDARISPLEPGWEGHLTFEIANLTPYRNRVYAGAGITQLLFFRLSQNARPYVGRYQNQPAEIVQARS
jgi:dCTP deaminase